MAISRDRIEYFALLAEIIGALGVIISVVYLAVQVGDGNHELRAQNHHNALTLAQRPMELLIEYEGLAEIVMLGRDNPSTLTKVQAEQLQHYNFLLFNSWEFSFLQKDTDAIPAGLWLGHDGWMRGEVVRNQAFKDSWRNLEHAFSGPFQSYVNDLIETTEDRPLPTP